jgi:uncharacterized protein YdbL (DUF1318 family)
VFRIPTSAVIALASLLTLATTVSAASKKELQARFEKRYPQLLEYKRDGKVGETMEGMVEAVDRKYLSDEKLADLIKDENADRKELYHIIANEEKTDPAKVAERMAQRNYERAHSGEYLKDRDGKWRKHS